VDRATPVRLDRKAIPRTLQSAADLPDGPELLPHDIGEQLMIRCAEHFRAQIIAGRCGSRPLPAPYEA